MSNECTKTMIDWLSAALTPIIAIVTTYIAIQQYRLEKKRGKHELYEKRLDIYKNISKFLGHIMAKAALYDYEVLINYRRDIAEAYFLFDDRLNQYFEEIYKKGTDLITTSNILKEDGTISEEKRAILIEEQRKMVEWFIEQNSILREKIKNYLRIEI